ncbi:hypothetical protein I4U23_000250 [Adineta vaga]|nr:hypothetical protein I4U23_000250 [Adineta vaga]
MKSSNSTNIHDLIPNLSGFEDKLLNVLWDLTLSKGPHAEQTFKGTEWTHAFSAFIAPSLTERSNAWLSTPISQSVREELIRDRQEGIPDLNQSGRLPPGIYHTTFNELITRFATNSYRITLIEHLDVTLHELRDAGVREIIIGGSFISSTIYPGDIDMVYVRNGNINQEALINSLWKAHNVNIHVWAADREHMPLTARLFDPNRCFSFLQFLRTYQEKDKRQTKFPREQVGVIHLSLDELSDFTLNVKTLNK